MMTSVRRPLLAAAVAATFLWTACGHNPSAPNTGPSPQIMNIVPVALFAEDDPQTLMIGGINFENVTALNIAWPSGIVQTLSGADIQGLQSTSFQVQSSLVSAGAYGFSVRTSDGVSSVLFAVTVQDRHATPSVVVTSVDPAVVQASVDPQLVTVEGANFVTGLSIRLTAPDGSNVTGGAGINVTPAMFQVNLVFSIVGDYTLVVVNPNGSLSNPTTVTVTSPGNAARSATGLSGPE